VDFLKSFVNIGNGLVWETPEEFPWLVAALLGVGVLFAIRLGVIQFRRLGHAIKVVTGKYDDPNDPGDINHFQALSTALSATVGIGNIAGVAVAIHWGGPGAVFWMWVTAALGMGVKYAECTLSTHYRSYDEEGNVSGGPMYYIERGLGEKWKPLAVFFAVCAIFGSFGGGNMNQANTVADSMFTAFGVNTALMGGLMAVIVATVVLGGVKQIGKVTSTLAPSMAIVYVLGALTILLLNVSDVPGAFATIVREAFNPTAGVSGVVTGGFMTTLVWGVKRGLFSNEAGQGSAPIAHAAAKTDEPVREGAVAMLEPMIDTLIICTMTALVIVVTGVWDKKVETQLDLSIVKTAVVEGASVPDDGIIPVVDGKQEILYFIEEDARVDEPRVLTADGKPLSGSLKFDKEAGHVTEILSAGAPVAAVLTGQALRNGAPLTQEAFRVGMLPLGDWGNYVVVICVVLFGISTMISWSYYGDRCTEYLFGVRYVKLYRLIFCGFIFLGSILTLKLVWAYGDLALGLMTLPNLIALALLSPKVVELTKDYFGRMDELEGKDK